MHKLVGQMMSPALLVIDLQRWFLEVGPAEKLARVGKLIRNTNALIDSFHDRDLPVVRILTVHKADGSTWNQWMKDHNSPRLIEGTSEAVKVIVRVNASPAFAFFGSGVHASTPWRFREQITNPSFSAPGGRCAVKLTASVFTAADSTVASRGFRLKRNLAVRGRIICIPAVRANTVNPCRCTV